ncbi:uncharacterized protein [Watersipora subatra]|uniref:uncharacterized protein n=1 Tax=Watersipora subatra TaxID=2589382 RepID=UPI00355BFF11
MDAETYAKSASSVSCKCLNVQFGVRSLTGIGHVSDENISETKPVSDGFDRKTDFQDAATINSLLVSPRLVKTALSEPNYGANVTFMYLVGSKRVGDWVIFRCLNCDIVTHAVSAANSGLVLVNAGEMLSPSDRDSMLKRNPHYCHALGIVCFPSNTYHAEKIKGSLKPSITDFIRNVKDSVSDFLEKEKANMRDRVQQFEKEQMIAYQDLEYVTQKNQDNLEKRIWTIFGEKMEDEDSAFEQSVEAISLDSPKLSTGKKERSSSAVDDMFELDPFAADEDDETANDDNFDSDAEDIPNYQTRGRYAGTADNLAKSVPIPIMRRMLGSTGGLIVSPDSPHERTPDPENMEASINALARSVGFDGTEIFGDLPRPRFNTGTRNTGARHY